MDHDAHEDHEDTALRELLAAHVVPEPSPDFVDDTVLRIQLDAHTVPDPSPDFVETVMAGLARDGLVSGTRPTLQRATELGERRLRLVPLLLAAAVLLGFLLPNLIRGTGDPEAFLDQPSTSFAEVSSVSFDENATEHDLRPADSDVVPAIWLPSSPDNTEHGKDLLQQKWQVRFK